MAQPETTRVTPRTPNVGEIERWASAIGGGLLVLRGLTKRSLGGVAMTFIGGLLLNRGLTGHCPTYQALGVSTVTGEKRRREGAVTTETAMQPPVYPSYPPGEAPHDVVEEASEESFPASDSPAWIMDSHVGPPPRRKTGRPTHEEAPEEE